MTAKLSVESDAGAPARVVVSREGDRAVAQLSGVWSIRGRLPSSNELRRALDASPRPRRLSIEASGVESWDSSLPAFLAAAHDQCAARGVEIDTAGAPEGARHLLAMARPSAEARRTAPGAEVEDRRLSHALASWAKAWGRAFGERRPAGAAARPEPLDKLVGRAVIEWAGSLGGKVDFLGSSVISAVRMLTLRTRRLPTRFLLQLERAGLETLPIVALMAFSIGAVLALITAGQLQKFGATPLVARIASIAVLREMGALMVGIAIGGRLGAAIAAELATMVSKGEVNALRFVGIDPFDYLVAPRLLALAVAGPLLVVYANALGLLGGLFVGVAAVGLPAQEYADRMREVLGYKHVIAGLIKGLAFGTLTALVASYHGLQSGRSAEAVAHAVRRAVVSAVLGVVVADAVITLVFKWVRL